MTLKIFGSRIRQVYRGLFVTMACASFAHSAEIDFTRHLAQYGVSNESSTVYEDTFSGTSGIARLIVTTTGQITVIKVNLNGVEVIASGDIGSTSAIEVQTQLIEENVLQVAIQGTPDSSAQLRIKQSADVELQVYSRVHFNTNVSNFSTSREFYGNLGFETLSGFPDTNTLAMARAIGIETPTSYDGSKGDAAGGYLLHGELIGVGGFSGGLIDLIEFSIPRNEEPPYAALNHLGMARAAMHTTNLDADYTYMKTLGVEFLSAPVDRSDGTRFAIFMDPDGTYYELIEVEGEDEPDELETSHIVSLGHVNVNVSDFARSAAWYQMLGYQVLEKLAPTDSADVANALGLKDGYEIDGAVLQHPGDESTLELVQWIRPYNPESAYAVPVNHFGIHRMAFATSDIEADVAVLKAQGVEFVSEITPCCSGPDSWGSIVAFYDPDGTIVELVEQPGFNQLIRFMRWLKNFFS